MIDKSVYDYINKSDTDLVLEAVTRVNQGFDLTGMSQQFDSMIRLGMLKEAVRIQWRIVGALTRTIVNLEKQNALMEKDYRRLGRGRNANT